MNLLLPVLAASAGLLCGGCSTPATTARPAVDVAQRPGAKTTCPEAVLVELPKGAQTTQRTLVGFNPTLLGVESTVATAQGRASSWTLDIVSGGYVDDLTESYDDLRVTGTTPVAGQEATVFSGSLLEEQVWVAIWRDPGTSAPCDVHSVAGSNMSHALFEGVLKSVRVQRSVTAAGSDGGTN